MTEKTMTLEEVKKHVAKENGYESWNDMLRKISDRNRKIKVAYSIEKLTDEVAELYVKEQVKSLREKQTMLLDEIQELKVEAQSLLDQQ